MKSHEENRWKKIQFTSRNCNLHWWKYDGKQVLYKTKERKKKNSFSSASDRFSRKTRTKNTSAFFFQRSRVVFKVTVRDPETPLISKIFNHRRRGTKTRLVLGSGQPRQRVMKTFPSFFLLFPFLLFPFFFPFFFFAPKRQLQTIQLRATRGRAVSRQKRRVVIPLFLFEAAPRVHSLSSNAFPSGQQQQLWAPYVSTYNADWQRAPHKITSVEENTDHMDGC